MKCNHHDIHCGLEGLGMSLDETHCQGSVAALRKLKIKSNPHPFVCILISFQS